MGFSLWGGRKVVKEKKKSMYIYMCMCMCMYMYRVCCTCAKKFQKDAQKPKSGGQLSEEDGEKAGKNFSINTLEKSNFKLF